LSTTGVPAAVASVAILASTSPRSVEVTSTCAGAALRMLGDKQAVKILFDDVAPRFADRDGGYTRVLRLAKPRLGDAGVQAILEFVGKNDRVRKQATRPAFESDTSESDTSESDAVEEINDIAPSEPVDSNDVAGEPEQK